MRFKRLNIETYEPGKSSLKRFHQVVKLSANESALGVSSKAKKILSNKNFFLSLQICYKYVIFKIFVQLKFKEIFCQFINS